MTYVSSYAVAYAALARSFDRLVGFVPSLFARRPYPTAAVSFWENPGVTALLGAAAGAALAYIQSALAARAKASEELRGRRLEAYPAIWRQTAWLYRDAAANLTWEDMERMHLEFRRWYFTTGGLFLSRRSTDRLNDVQELLSAHLSRGRDLATEVEDDVYKALTETCSAFRTALAEDLATRQQRSIVWALARLQWHGRQRRKARRRIKAAGFQRRRYPRDKLDLSDDSESRSGGV